MLAFGKDAKEVRHATSSATISGGDTPEEKEKNKQALIKFIADKVCGWGESRGNYATTAYFDLEKCAWRSFRWENLIAVY